MCAVLVWILHFYCLSACAQILFGNYIQDGMMFLDVQDWYFGYDEDTQKAKGGTKKGEKRKTWSCAFWRWAF